MRTLTLHLKICSAMPIVTGVERDFVDSGEVLQDELNRLASLEVPLLPLLLPVDHLAKSHLRN
jgi:hypothetical protein